MSVLQRRAARVLLLDPADRLLLLRYDGAQTDGTGYWLTPGGGLEAGENPEQAARRELAEETGLVDLELGPAVWTRTAQFVFRGQQVRQEEVFLLGCVPEPVEVRRQGHWEPDGIVAARWFAPGELAAEPLAVWPRDLGRHLEQLLAGPLPARPVPLVEGSDSGAGR